MSDTVALPLPGGFEALIDVGDAHLAEFNWYAVRRGASNLYAVRSIQLEPGRRGRKALLYLHRVVMQAPPGMEVDHIDGDGLNNRRSNLRLATHTQNTHNTPARPWSRSGIKGVWWSPLHRKWVSQIRANGQRYSLGLFGSSESAAEAYAAAAARLHGAFACTKGNGTGKRQRREFQAQRTDGRGTK